MREPSASGLPLARECAHPWTSGIRWPSDRSDASDFGTLAHRGAESLVTGEPLFPALLAGLSDAERWSLAGHVDQARAFLGHVRPGQVFELAELPLRYDVESGASRRVGRHRRLEIARWTAVIDYVGAIRDGRIRIVNWKTGRQAHAARAAVNAQLRFEALAAARWAGAWHVRAQIVYLSEDSYEVDSADFGPMDLATIAEETRELRETLTRGPTPPVPGVHCTRLYCPLRGVCRATHAALGAAYPAVPPLPTTIENDEDARRVTEELPLAEAALAGLKAARDEYVRRQAITLSTGETFGYRQHETRKVRCESAKQREAILRVLGEHGHEAIAVSHDTTIGRIEAACRKKLAAEGKTRGLSALVEQVLAALREVGGYSISTWEKPEAFRAKE